MPFNLALADLVSPYLLKGENLGPQHAALSAIRVREFEVASEAFGVVIRGVCEFIGAASIDVGSGRIVVQAAIDEATPPFNPDRKAPLFELREASLDFELLVPRVGSGIIAVGVAAVGGVAFAAAQDVLDAWEQLPLGPPPSDFPSSGFRLDLVLNAPTLRPPFLHPAKMTPEGWLVPDPDSQEVALRLPRLRFRLLHGNPIGSALRFQLVSLGVAGLDDPGDIGVTELLSMEPPYVFIGDRTDRTVGFGFRSAVLDLSNSTTPPAVTEKFGFGDDWGGIYLPEVRLFVAPEGVRDLAFEAGVRDLLIGLGEHSGISGDFQVSVINQGSGAVEVGARFFDANGRAYDISRTDTTTATADLPELTRMVVDIQGGRAPYICTVQIGGSSAQTGRLFNVNLTGVASQTITINVVDSSTAPITASLQILARKHMPQVSLPTPGTTATPKLEAKLTTNPGDQPRIVIASQNEHQVILTTDLIDPSIRWTLVGDPAGESGPQASFAVTLASGETKTVQARRPGTTVPTALDYYFFYDEPRSVPQADEANRLREYTRVPNNVSTARAVSENQRDRELGGRDPFEAYREYLELVPPSSNLIVRGEASYEGRDNARYNYQLARRRAIAIAERIKGVHSGKNFDVEFDPEPREPTDAELTTWTTNWETHVDPPPEHPEEPGRRGWWKARLALPPGLGQPERQAQGTLTRPAAPAPPPEIPVKDPPAPATPRAPDWFRFVRVKVRIVRDSLVAAEIEGEIDMQTATEAKIAESGAPAAGAPDLRTLENGVPLAPDNPADGITRIRALVQKDNATGRLVTLLQIGADPADKDGLLAAGWLPGEPIPAAKDFAVTLLGSYISFWPLLVMLPDGNAGSIEDAALAGATLALPAAIAALPWFRVERVILYGGEYLQRDRGGEWEAFLLFDVQVDWSVDISVGSTVLIEIEREHPLAIRYKAIGLRFGNRSETGSPQFALRPVFDASRGYTIDVAKNGSLKVADPFDQVLKVLAARISRTNPLLFEIDVSLAVDLGVVSIDRARVRAELGSPGSVELTALAASVDIPGALVGSGYMQIGDGTIGGQLDLTIRPLALRVAAAMELKQFTPAEGGPATGVYVGLNVVLPVGIPLGQSGLGIFGFRGIFGMHYQRNQSIGAGSGVPALAWLAAAEGQPNLLAAPSNPALKLWQPQIDSWAFGIGILIGTMEGGFIVNLDGTLLLELPGPRVLIIMNARIVSPPPELDGLGTSGGVLAVIEITPDHFMIGVLVQYDIESLITIRVPAEAVFQFADTSKWHVYLGQRSVPVEVNVLGIVRGTGYLMFQGDGLPAYKSLPAIKGIGVGLGAGASFTWGSTAARLYLRVGGGMDAVIGFDPFILGGHFEVSGELRLFIVSVGAHARLSVVVTEVAPTTLNTYIDGEACGRVSFFFFSVSGCVRITIASPVPPPPLPALVEKLSVKSRSPALALGTGVDRPVDASLGDAIESTTQPAASDPDLITVPIDSVPVLSMVMPPVANGLTFLGSSVNGSSGLSAGGFASRGAEKYQYTLTSVTLERVSPAGPPAIGSTAPATWWTLKPPTEENIVAQLALLTWEATAAPKAIEKSEVLEESITDRWGRVCDDAAPPASVLWTFRWEKLGPSTVGWDLEGIAWPDPPGTQRSEEPDTLLHVTERWRSGDTDLDAKRGIIPAIVVGALVPCRQPDRPNSGGPTVVVGGRGPAVMRGGAPAGAVLAADDAVLERLARGPDSAPFRISSRLYERITAFEAVDAPAASFGDLLGRDAAGSAVTRAELLRAMAMPVVPPGRLAPPQGRRCDVRVLQAPIFDDGRAVVFGNPAKEKEIQTALDAAGITHGPLDDVVVLKSGAFKETRLLLFASPTLLRQRRLVARVLAADGVELLRVAAAMSDQVPSKPLPAAWMDASGPWSNDVTDVLAWSGASGFKDWLPVLVDLKGGDKADRIEIGVLPGPAGEGGQVKRPLTPRYFVGAIESLRGSEVARHEWDDFQITKDRDLVTSVLGPDSTENALLFPGSLYRVSATWTGQRAPREGESVGATASDTQVFWFRTDSTPPPRLDPWVLLTLPADGESCVFGAEPVRIVFNTHDIDRLYGAYGKELRIRFQAASAHHPAPKPTVPHPFPVNSITLKRAKADILSPWEETLAEVIGKSGPCIAIDEDRSRQSTVTIPIPLDPYTDYVLDVEMVDASAAETAGGPRVYRRHFSTGAYGTFADFAASLQGVRVSHRYVAAGGMGAVRAFFNGRAPEGAELDEQLRDKGLEAMGAPLDPRIVVFWEQSGSSLPQPSAVLIDASEPLWRARPYAAKVTDDTGPITTERWRLEDREWLRLEAAAASDPVIADNGLIRCPGGQRALVVLKPGSRGQVLRLELVQPAFPESYINTPEKRVSVVEIEFDRAPWEE